MLYLKKIVCSIDRFSTFVGSWLIWLIGILTAVTFFDVLARYLFKQGSVAMQELEWHIFSLIFLLGGAYTLKENQHIRVDIFYSRLSKKYQALVDLIGTFFFLIPFAIMVIYTSYDFIALSYSMSESSSDPGGLPARYILKSFIMIGFIMLIIQAFSLFCDSLMKFLDERKSS